MKFNKKRKGFTIVELVIVIAVIAVLAAVLIPTFVHVVNDARNAADKATARSMNEILIADEAVNGAPVNPKDAMDVLIASGIDVDSYTELDSGNVLYWDSAENRIIVYSRGGVIYPDDLATKYSKTSTKLDYWYSLNSEYGVIELEGATASDLTTAINKLQDSETLKLTSDVNIGDTTLPFKSTGITSIDLNGHTLTSTSTYSMNIQNGAQVIIRNGELQLSAADPYKCSMAVLAGSSVTLENVEYTAVGSGILPAGDAAQVNVINSTINAGCYCVGTNAGSTTNYYVQITIKDSVLNAANEDFDNCPVCLNVPGTLYMENCTVTGQRQAVMVRAGTATIKNCKLINTGEYGNGSYGSQNQYIDANWGTGNEVPAAALVVGNRNGNYNADAICTLVNTQITAQNEGRTVYIYGNENYRAVLTHDSSSVLGTIEGNNDYCTISKS